MVKTALALALAAAPPGAATNESGAAPSPSAGIDDRPQARVGRGSIFIDRGAPLRAPTRRRVHGHARLGLGFGSIAEDPAVALVPAIALDLRAFAPVRLAFAVPLRLRMVDRAPGDPGAFRRRDWDEAGDVLAIIQQVAYQDDYAVGRAAHVHVQLDAGAQRDARLGHGSLVRGWANSLDIDRRRTGLATDVQVVGSLLDKPAAASVDLLLGDLAGSQILGARAGASWAGAGIGVSVVGDPTAPRQLQPTGTAPQSFVTGGGNRLRELGARGVVAAALELEYKATDRWRWSAGPYLDLDLIGGAGKGMHVGADGDVQLGPRHQVTLGATGELTVGSAGYDPAYFDVFYGSQRWQAPFVATPGSAPDGFAAAATPKYAFIRDRVPRGVGGMGELRFAHDRGATARVEYRYRPGPLGHTAALVVGVDLPAVGVFARLAHRGTRHGFEGKLAGTLAQLELRVPILRWLDVDIAAGWTFGTRVDRRTGASGGSLVTGAGTMLAGVAGRVPW
jgi:hypothetical protein